MDTARETTRSLDAGQVVIHQPITGSFAYGAQSFLIKGAVQAGVFQQFGKDPASALAGLPIMPFSCSFRYALTAR